MIIERLGCLEFEYRTRGRYVPTAIVNRALRDEFDEDRLRHISTQGILQSAIPQCISVRLEEGPDERWITVADPSAEGRIIPEWLAAAVVKRGVKDERWDVIEILYGAAALSGLPPVKLVSVELDVPRRVAAITRTHATRPD